MVITYTGKVTRARIATSTFYAACTMRVTIKEGDIIGVLSLCGDLNKLCDRLS